MTRYKIGAALILPILIPGCGGGGDSGLAPVTISDAVLSGYELTDTGIVEIAGESDGGADTITIDTLSGSYDPATGTGNLDGGGTITLDVVGDAVALFLAEPTLGGTRQGLIGVPTLLAEVPSGAPATYEGLARVMINDGTHFWELEGESNATIYFDGSGSIMTIDNLNGTRTDGGAVTTNVSSVATFTFDDIGLFGGKLSGSTVTLTSDQLSGSLSGSEDVDLQGGLYGGSASTVGAIFIVDDVADGNISAQGGIVAER